MNKGYLIILTGYVGWGLFPLYWALLAHVPPLEVLMHRMLWAVPFLILLVMFSVRRKTQVIAATHSWSEIGLLSISSVVICLNWGIFIWAVANQRVIEASMGYFLTPLLNVIVGLLIFREKLDPLKMVAIGFAAAGVLYYIVKAGIFPWVGLSLGLSFAAYGTLRKKMETNAIPGLLIETLILLPFTIGVIVWLHSKAAAMFMNDVPTTDLWLILAGPITVIPLALFTMGARMLPMTSVGILFYVTPTLQFLCGILFFGEAFNQDKLIGFAAIWIGLFIFSYSLLSNQTRTQSEVA
jgi:chloramphenicol-sensitive protein RarD